MRQSGSPRANTRTSAAPGAISRVKSASPKPRKAVGSWGKTVSPEERDCMIREAAYLRAERRGFAGGSALEDWLAAEAEIDRALGNT